MSFRFIASILVLTGTILFSWPASAQTETGTATLIEEAKKAGSTIVVITPDDGEKAAVTEPSTLEMAERGVLLSITELRRIVGGWSTFTSEMMTTLVAQSPDGHSGWVMPTVLSGLIFIAIGIAAAWFVGRWFRNQFLALHLGPPVNRGERLSRLAGRFILLVVEVLIVLIVAGLLAAIFQQSGTGWKVTIVQMLMATLLIGIFRAIVLTILTPFEEQLRVIPLSNHQSRRLYLQLMSVAAVSIVIVRMCHWMERLGLPEEPHKFALLFGTAITAVGLMMVCLLNRESISQLIAGNDDDPLRSRGRRFLGRIWPAFAIAYFTVAWIISAVRVLLDRPNALGLVGTPILVLITGLFIYGLLLLIVDKILERRRAIQSAKETEAEAAASEIVIEDVSMETEAVPDVEDESAMTLTTETSGPILPEEEEEVPLAAADAIRKEAEPLFQNLMERAAAVVAIVSSMYLMALIWGVNLTDPESPLRNLMDILIVAFIAYVAYQATRLWLDLKIAEESGADGEHGAGESEMGGPGASRMATLLPIFRNVLLITIFVIAIMMILSNMGIDIGPLIAGAGVVGLAIGFGAQTLVKDIISGAFFLMDDAFRQGEYIDIGSAKGTVEKTSVRSMQLRHHNGPLNTIPFGEIRQLTNYSRDWVIMKLKLRVTYDTDVDKVRRLMKALGQELLQHEELGHLFLQPLKSQGVYAMEDSAMIIRVKFKTKPGDQFMIRKLVYQRIREIFAEEGIKFAHKEVRVRLADEEDEAEAQAEAAGNGAPPPPQTGPGGTQPQGDGMTTQRKEQVAAAAARVIIDEEEAAKAPPTKPA